MTTFHSLDCEETTMFCAFSSDVKLFSSRILDQAGSGHIPGRISRHKRKGLQVETGQGVIEVGEIQYPGKRRMASVDFLRGFDLPDGSILE